MNPRRSLLPLTGLLLAAGLLLMPAQVTAVVVRVETVIGSFDITMREDEAPNTVANFLNYVRDRDYDNTFFHRSVPDFIVQTGGFRFSDTVFSAVPTDPPVINEFGLSNIRGTVAMAKQSGDPDSATAQWFINLKDNSSNLDNQNGGFTVLGEIGTGDMAVADAVGDVPDAIAGVEIDIINGSITPPLSDTEFASVLSTLPALNLDLTGEINFVPSDNLVLIRSMRETGADLLAEPGNLDFGLIVAGETADRSVVLVNRGLADVTFPVPPRIEGDAAFEITGNNCPAALATDQSCVLTVRFTAMARAAFSGSLVIQTNDTDRAVATIGLGGESALEEEARISLDPAGAVDFGEKEVGQTASRDIVVSNIGNASLVVEDVTITGAGANFFAQVNDCGVVDTATTCVVTVTFTAESEGPSLAVLEISSNDPSQPLVTAQLSGSGVIPLQPDIAVSDSLDFGDLAVNDIFTRSLVIANNGEGRLDLNGISLAGENPDDFLLNREFCNVAVAPGGSCPLRITFRPGSEGRKTAVVRIDSNDPDSPVFETQLTGNVQGFVDPYPTIDVAPILITIGGSTVDERVENTITVTNPLGSGNLQVDDIRITGPSADSFSQTSNCSIVEPITGECEITLVLQASIPGPISAVVTIFSNDPEFPAVEITLAGSIDPEEGVDIAYPEMVAFGDVAIGTTAAEQVRLSNSGSDPLRLDGIDLAGDGAAQYGIESSCPGSLESGETCTVTLTFSPLESGPAGATLRVVSNDPDEPSIDIPVTGAGALDSDGVADPVEDGHPQKNSEGRGDGNADGVADATQSNVASLVNIFGEYVTLEVPAGLRLTEVRAVENPLPSGTPTGFGTSISFDKGFFEYSVRGVTGPVTVRMIFSGSTRLSNLFMIGNTADNPVPHWYLFDFDGSVGAEISGNEIRIHLVDGARGDSDLEINGTIVDPAAPALVQPQSVSVKSGSGGCAVTGTPGTPSRTLDWFLVMLVVVLSGYRYRRGPVPRFR